MTKTKRNELKKELKYALHVCVRPFDGFWDLKHEKRGSVEAASIIFAAWLIIQALAYRYTGVVVYIVNWEYFNVWRQVLMMATPILLWCIANWCLTTLMDGKGTFKDIYIASCYALTPYVIINPILIILSNILTYDELAFYWFLLAFSSIWYFYLMLVAMKETHEYSMGKAFFSSLLTIFGIGVMIFLFFIFFSLITNAIAFFISTYKEVVFRFY